MSWLVFTGAGVSKDSGIPTFEELGDLRLKLSRSYFRSEPKAFYQILKQIEETARLAEPNAAHLAIAKAQLQVVTMNIDGLHHKAGSTRVLEIHGNLRQVYCPNCFKRYPFEQVYTQILSMCCHVVLEPEVVLYEDALKGLEEGFDLLNVSDGLLIIGTSFYTSTAGYFHQQAKYLGLPIQIINAHASIEVPKWINLMTNNLK